MNASTVKADTLEPRHVYKKKSQIREVWERYKRDKLAMFGLILFVIMCVAALSTNFFVDYDGDVITMHLNEKFWGPSADHWLGTDLFGREILSRILWGARISMFIGMASVLMSLIFGTIIGAAAGYFGGWIDEISMRLMDVVLAIPETLLAICIVAAMGNSIINLLLAISIGQIPKMARMVRSTVLTIKDVEYIEAAKACGTSTARIIGRHILPNAIGPIVVNAMLTVSRGILQIASLSFIGLGIAPPTPEWGNMLSEARDYIRMYPYQLVPPSIAIMMTVSSLTLIGDGIQAALDPKLKN